MTPDHSAYNPHPLGTAGRTYCPACLRIARWGVVHGTAIFWRHWVDPDVPKGGRDRCVNSRKPVWQARFVDDDGLLVTRATYELAKGPR